MLCPQVFIFETQFTSSTHFCIQTAPTTCANTEWKQKCFFENQLAETWKTHYPSCFYFGVWEAIILWKSLSNASPHTNNTLVWLQWIRMTAWLWQMMQFQVSARGFLKKWTETNDCLGKKENHIHKHLNCGLENASTNVQWFVVKG